MYESSSGSSSFFRTLASQSDTLIFSGSARPRAPGEFVRVKEVRRRRAASVAFADGIRGDFWTCLAVALLGVDGSNVSLPRSFLSSSAAGGGRGGYNAMYSNCRICDLGFLCGSCCVRNDKIQFGSHDTHSEGLNCDDRSCSRTEIPDSYWPSSKQVSTRPR
jgi:hypothetical protein